MEDEEDYLSPEEIEAATRKIIPCYYAYYNATGEITAVSNTLLDNADTFLQISYEVFEQFVMGREYFKDWVVNRTKNSANEFGVEIVSKSDQAHTFRNNMFERITTNADDAELTVHWDQYNKKWIFIISDIARQQVYDNEIGTKTLNFFVTYSSSFNFLIRIIEIPINQLISDKVEIPFQSDKESDISNINLSTKHVFDNYSLAIWKEHEQ
jgi:hypothetical protein